MILYLRAKSKNNPGPADFKNMQAVTACIFFYSKGVLQYAPAFLLKPDKIAV
jgi:hypothetical protein